MDPLSLSLILSLEIAVFIEIEKFLTQFRDIYWCFYHIVQSLDRIYKIVSSRENNLEERGSNVLDCKLRLPTKD